MQFTRCGVDTRSENSLMSPEFTLQTDKQLKFKMSNLQSGKLAVYQTSATRHPTTMIRTYYPSKNNRQGSKTRTICLPAGTYQLVFVAAENNKQSEIFLRDVSLKSSSCTYSPLSGNGNYDWFY